MNRCITQMKTIEPGYEYELENVEAKDKKGQIVQFIEKTPVLPCGSEMLTVNDGTTNEEVLKMLIARLMFLQAKFPCVENKNALSHIERGLLWLNKRTQDRIARRVKGKNLP